MIYVPSREIVLPGERCRRCGKPIARPPFRVRPPRRFPMRSPRRQPLRMLGDNVQVGSDDKVRVQNDALVIGGPGDACCCSCTACTLTNTPVSFTFTTGIGLELACRELNSGVTRVSTATGGMGGLTWTVPNAGGCLFSYSESPLTSFAYTVFQDVGSPNPCAGGTLAVTLDLLIEITINSFLGAQAFIYLIYGPTPADRMTVCEGDYGATVSAQRCDAYNATFSGCGSGGSSTITPNF